MCDLERHPQRFRRRQVKEPATGTGKRCNQTMQETQGCPEPAAQPCRLSEWSDWQALDWREPDPPACNKECGGGQAFRTRIMQEAPSNGGNCPDSSLRELKACNMQPCDSVCEMSDWSAWSPCSADCGRGTTTRARTLLSPAERFSEGCQGALEEALPCLGKDGACPHTDCQWSEWYDWSVCSASCGGGLTHRSRAISALPTNGGSACDTLTKSEAAPCNTQGCGEACVDGKWGDWQDWESCTASCGGAYTLRRRSAEQEPNACGKPVSGVRHEYKACLGLPPCTMDRDCEVSDWTEWSFCSATCYGVHERNRYIKVFPAGNGAHCDNTSLKEMAPCNPGPGEALAGACKLPDPMDCKLSVWGDWAVCSKSCGGGQRERRRKVLELPKNGGVPCDAELTITGPCNPGPCEVETCTDCAWGAWSDWGDCSKCHGERYRHRSIEQMPNHCGKMCDIKTAKEVSNCTGHCEETLFCTWTDWSAPSGCGAGCGHGTMMRSRALSLLPVSGSPDFLFSASMGAKCQGAQLNMSDCPDMQPCTPPCVPMDCSFSAWGEWSNPAPTGLCERHRNIAVTNNECGEPCRGPLGETKRCVLQNPNRKDCHLSDWTAWSPCQMNGKIGQRHRERLVLERPSFDGAPCNASLNETEQCSTMVLADCAFAEWEEWEPCRKSCGGGWQSRNRKLLSHAEHGGKPCEGGLAEMQMCNTLPCLDPEQDCLYGDWSSWSGCGADGQRYRERKIARYASGSGTLCTGDLEETASCGEDVQVDCVVSDWTAWDPCDKTCGGGQAQRQRQIMQFPENGGAACPSELVQTTGCNRNQCFVQDCQVSDWQAWSECSVSCGLGQQQRRREVLHVRSPGGVGCGLELSQLQSCSAGLCPADDCAWGEWSDWKACSCSCGGGQRSRSRLIAKMPSRGGKLCQAQDKEEMEPCSTQACAVPTCQDGLWSDWEPWSSCSASCGGGTTFRTRQVARMADECGEPVSGDARETKVCNAEVHCEPDIDCLFTDWGGWSACSTTCNGIMKRSRRIQRYGSGRGTFCEGSLKETWPCNPAPGEQTPSACAASPPVDCGLTQWSEWSDCSSSCGGGEQQRSRKVATPPSNGGRPCDGGLTVARQCSTKECPGPVPIDCRYGVWQDWGACGKCGGERVRFRHITQHPQHGGKPCEPFEAEEVGACPRQCHEKQYCAWGDWAPWGECTARCGEGRRMRRRHLGLTTLPEAPPAPVHEMMLKYAELRATAQSLEEGSGQELAVAFAGGLLSFVTVFASLRVFVSARAAARLRQASDTRASSPFSSPERNEFSAAELPLVGSA